MSSDESPSPPSPEDRGLIESSWRVLETDLGGLAERFYADLFERAPDVRPLFAGTDMEAQGKKLTDLLTVAVKGLGQFEFLVPAIAELGNRHRDYGVDDGHYTAMRDSLLGAIGGQLGEGYDPPTRTAWERLYDTLAEIMRNPAPG